MSVFHGAGRLLRNWFGGGQEQRDIGALEPGADEEHIRLLILFMSGIGAAMNGAGDATTFIRRSLKRIGYANGLPKLEIFVVPTLLLVRYGDRHATFVDLSSGIPTDLRLNQIAALYELVEDGEAGKVAPAEGLTRLRWLLAMQPRHSTLVRTLACGLIALGVLLSLRPSLEEILIGTLLGVGVGILREAARFWPEVWPLLPAAAGLIVGAITFILVDGGVPASPLHILIPALIIFLPGATITVALIELSNGDIVAGGSRLAYGTMRLFLLFFGVFIAAQWIGLPADSPDRDVIRFGDYLSLLGLLLFTGGVYLHFSAPQRSFPWLLFVVAAAWLGQRLGGILLGGPLDGFLGGVVMILVARLIQGRPGAPPLLVSFTPAFWFLVPGALGLEGLTNLLKDNPQSGIDDILSMITTMVAIALGVLFGLIIAGSDRSREPA